MLGRYCSTAVWVADPNEYKPMRSPLPSVEAAQPLVMSMVAARACSREANRSPEVLMETVNLLNDTDVKRIPPFNFAN